MNPSEHQIKTALISVSDKTGIVELATELSNMGVKLFSTGGTYNTLKTAGIEVTSVSELTGFPEILGGRVKTLHPAIHAGLLADLGNETHRLQLKDHFINSIDLLVVNLYPFEETLAKDNVSHEELIENIDIGGPGMLRAAAKNYKWTLPVVNPENYAGLLSMLKENNGCVDEATRLLYATEVFSHTAFYDSLIADYLNFYNRIEFPKKLSISLREDLTLRYGENPHQNAKLYGNFSMIFKHIHGKELSFNNIIDIDAAAGIISEFSNQNTCVILKHTNPCGVGVGDSNIEAYDKAFSTDTLSPFGGIVAVNKTVEESFAQHIHSIFMELIIAPHFTDGALDILTKKKDRRLIQMDLDLYKNSQKYQYRSVAGGMLIQTADSILMDKDNVKVVTDREPTDDEWSALMLGWKVVKHVKSNAIVFANSDRTLGIGAGQMSRVDSSRIAVEKAKMMKLNLQGSVIASDAFFPFPDGLIQAAEAGVTAVIQPGGSVRDEDVIKAANEYNLAMIFTGARHFKH